MRKNSRCIVVVALMLTFAAQPFAEADNGRILRSAVFPGMGQLGDGGGELNNGSTLKGLSFMTAEILCVSLITSELSKRNAYAKETSYLKARYQEATTVEAKTSLYADWQESINKSATANGYMLAGIAAGAVVWGLNLADIVLFPPKTSGPETMLRSLSKNTVVAFGPGSASMIYQWSF